MQAPRSPRNSTRSPWIFFGLVFVLAIPFWILGPVAEQLLPRERPINLPLSALQFVCPVIAAAILVYREDGADGVKRLLKRSFDFGRIKGKRWYAPIFFLLPLLLVVEYGVLRLLGVAVPAPQFPVWIVPVFFAAFFIAALCEELGWSGYAIDPLQARWTALGAGVIMGIVWAVWHIVPNTQAPHSPLWLVGQFGNTVTLRVLIVWLYNNTGKSVFAASAFHAMTNVGEFLFPVYGSYYDPFLFFLITAVAAAIIVVIWGPRTVARWRFARRR
jgi:CAAX protease family protein